MIKHAMLLFLAVLALAFPVAAPAKITAANVAVVIDPTRAESVAIGNYAAARRGYMKIYATISGSKAADYFKFEAQVKAQLASHPEIKVLGLAIRDPERSRCAPFGIHLAMGYQWSTSCYRPVPTGLEPTPSTWNPNMIGNPYYGSTSDTPTSVNRNNGTGLLTTTLFMGSDIPMSVDAIDRAIAHDGSRPTGTSYVRYVPGTAVQGVFGEHHIQDHKPDHYGAIKLLFDKFNPLTGKTDVFSWLEIRDGLAGTFTAAPTNQYVGGGVFVNLDSFGGRRKLAGCETMSKWFDTWVCTASEPYANWAKFVDIDQYTPCIVAGNSEAECLWKSVDVPLNSTIAALPDEAPYGVKGNDFPAPKPPSDPCLSNHIPSVIVHTIAPSGTRLAWFFKDSTGKVIKTGTSTVPTSQNVKLGAQMAVDVDGPITVVTAVDPPFHVCTIVH